MGQKLKILKNKRCLANTSYYIKEDYPKAVLEKRKDIPTQLETEKQLGNTAFIKYDKLIVLKNIQNLSRSRTNKRTLSESPELPPSTSQAPGQGIKQPIKKNKSANMKDYVLQKPKLTYNKSDQTTIKIKP